MLTQFRDRREAGRHLAGALRVPAGPPVRVLALPRGGVPVGYEVAAALGAPLDVFVVRKLGVPGHEELAMGAIAQGGIRVLNEDVIGALGIPAVTIERVAAAETAELARRERIYRGGAPAPDLRGNISTTPEMAGSAALNPCTAKFVTFACRLSSLTCKFPLLISA